MLAPSDAPVRGALLMVRLSSTLELLVAAGSSPSEQYDLLRWVRCLSPQGLADRAAVLALLEDVARQHSATPPELMTLGAPTCEQSQAGALRAAGFLDPAGCEAFDAWPGDWETVERVVAEARAALGPGLGQLGAPPGRAAGPPAGTVVCRTCGQRVPAGARYCGYCGIRIGG